MELKLTKEERQELMRFVKFTFKTIDRDELGDDWWTSHIGYDINIFYDEESDAYCSTAYPIEDGTIDTSKYTTIIYLA